MAITVLLLTGMVAFLCVTANDSNFGPMRAMLAMAQLALVIVRDLLLAITIARQSRWLALANLLVAAAAFLCLLASQHGYGELSDAALLLAPVAAFGIPLTALLAIHWRHPAPAILCACVVLTGAYVNGFILPQIFRSNAPPPIPLAANAPLEDWRPYFMGPQRDRVIAILKQRPTLEADLIAGLRASDPLEILHTFDLISALKPAPTPALREAFQTAQKYLAPLVTPKTEEAWRIRTRHASEALGEPVP